MDLIFRLELKPKIGELHDGKRYSKRVLIREIDRLIKDEQLTVHSIVHKSRTIKLGKVVEYEIIGESIFVNIQPIGDIAIQGAEYVVPIGVGGVNSKKYVKDDYKLEYLAFV